MNSAGNPPKYRQGDFDFRPGEKLFIPHAARPDFSHRVLLFGRFSCRLSLFSCLQERDFGVIIYKFLQLKNLYCRVDGLARGHIGKTLGKKMKFFSGICVTLIFCGILSAASLAGDAARWTVTLPQQPQASFAGIYYAKEAGIFAKHGLDVEIRHVGANDGPVTGTLASGQSQFVVAPLTAALVERAKGTALVNICQLNRSGNVLLIADRRSGIRQLADLKKPRPDGKPLRFGVRSGDAGIIPRLFFRQQGIGQEIVLLKSDGVSLFLWGALDAIYGMEYDEYYQLLAAGQNPEELTVFRLRDHQLNIPEDGLYTLKSTVAAHPEICAAMRSALLEGWRGAGRHPEQAMKYVRLYAERDGVRFDPAHQFWMLNLFGKSLEIDGAQAGTLDPAVYESTVRALRRSGLIAKSVEYRDFCPELPAPSASSGGKP